MAQETYVRLSPNCIRFHSPQHQEIVVIEGVRYAIFDDGWLGCRIHASMKRR
jgi:hypothetical protein